jgi:hypothetical protein
MNFEQIVEKTVQEFEDKPLSDRNAVVEKVCEEYVMKYGKKPDPYQLTLLANLILVEDTKNPDPYKASKEEYSFHSDSQRKRRNRKEFSTMDDTLEHINFKKKSKLSTAPPKEITL